MVQARVPRHIEQINAAWLEQVLADAGHDVRLRSIKLHGLDAENSQTARVDVRYAQNATNLPNRLFVKVCAPGHDFLGASEPAYYARDYTTLSNAPIPKCYASLGPVDVNISESLGAGYALILEDLSETHVDCRKMPKTKTLACQLGTALGQLHGNRWGYRADPEGSHDLGAAFERYYSHVSSGLTPVLQGLGASLTSKVEAALHKGFSTDRDVLRRGLLTGKGLTLLHGDPNPTNVMIPIDPAGAGGPLYLIDRQPFAWSPRLWLGAYDLVKATIPYWSIEASRDFRDPMLRSYLLALHTAGVQDYTWEDLLADWEACLVQALYIAVEWGTQPEDIADPEGMWARQLDRAVAALMLRE